ncbi:MAG TPA: YggT family protein [bacterium]|nr:YggT family protein [bacterium]HQO33277.1 YggT family protein [bacterium]HQP99212.1 YggT family protein [bacterium]
MSLLDHIVNIILVLLVVRFFLEEYLYFGLGPVWQTVFQITDFFCKPIQSALGNPTGKLQRAVPWIVIVLILVIRGLWRALPAFRGGQADISVIPFAVLSSLGQFVDLAYLLVVGLLLVSVLLAKGGVAFYNSVGYQAFQRNTFRILQITQNFLHTYDLWRLFGGSVLWLAGLHLVLRSVLSLTFLEGPRLLLGRELVFQMSTVVTLLGFYYFVLLIAIIISWVSPDPQNPVVAVIRALAEPYLRLFRRICPWARIGMLDFSPILAFFVLLLVQQMLAEFTMSTDAFFSA